MRRRISPCDGHWYIVLSYRRSVRLLDTGSNVCRLQRHEISVCQGFALWNFSTSRKGTEHVGVVYGAVSPAAAGRVQCNHGHHGWLSENVGVAERAVTDYCTEGRADVRRCSLIYYLAGINLLCFFA